MGKVVGIISIKGGVGKTSSVVALGFALANEFNQKVLVVDANFSAPNLGLHLGVVDPDKTIHDVMSDNASIEDAIYTHEAGFDVIAGSLIQKQINPYKLKNRIDRIKDSYDMILLDSSPTLNEEILATMIAADQLLVVTTPDYPTLSTTLAAVRLAKEKNAKISGLILNKVRGKNFELTLDEIEDAAQVPVLAVLPDDIGFLESLSVSTPLTHHLPKSDSSIEYKKLAGALLKTNFQDTRLKSVVKGFFTKDQKQELNRRVFIDTE